MAARQIIHHGSDAQRAEAAKVLADTRRALYRILAEDEPAGILNLAGRASESIRRPSAILIRR